MPATLFGSRFGRRLFVMFCLAALLPAGIVFWMTYRTATADAEAALREALRQGGKDYALGVYSRLDIAASALEAVEPDALAAGGAAQSLALFFGDTGFESRALPLGPAGAGMPAAPHRDGAVRLRVVPGAHGSTLQLLRSTAGGTLVATLDPLLVWGDPGDMRQDMRICMFAGRERLFCGGHPGTEHGDHLLAVPWTLFMRARFDADAWTVVAVAGAGHGLAHYAGVLAPAAAAVLLLALLLSSIQIRRVLVPLADLLRRIQALHGRGANPVRRQGEDEFGQLSRTFDGMQQRIAGQLDTLRALADADRLILQGAPLAELADLVARRLQQAVGPATVCIRVAAPEPGSAATLYLRRRAGGATECIPCDSDDGLPPASASRRWHPLEALDAGQVRDACQRDGAREACVLASPVEDTGRVRVVLGFDARPPAQDAVFAQAEQLAEAIPVALAFEERSQRLVFQARHDLLTGLPNRLATFEAVAATIERAQGSGARFAVAFLDLDRFKSINDGLGHASGDQLLAGVAQRIRACLSDGDFVGRFGGDEFCIILPDAGSADQAGRAMQRIVDGLLQPVQAGGREFLQRFSAGIAFHPEHGADASTLIRNADVAMYHAKRDGGRAHRVFAPEMNVDAQALLQMENDLRAAIAAGAIEVHYQPRVDSRDQRIVGVEALARWTHPQNGPIPPSTFIPLAEDTGLIDELGDLVLRTACAQMAAWRASGLALPLVAVNVSSHQLRSRRLIGQLRSALESVGLEPASLEIEITETMLVEDSEAGGEQLRGVRDLGVAIAVDDFGTGYSSLSYLAQLPVDTLKIDRAFVLGIGDGGTPTAAIVRAIIGLARDLGNTVVVEGVESMADVQLLAGWDAHTIQGYVFHRPLDAAALTALLRVQQRAA
jgi:diguanylate cyclase (GGDEF)-like protein